MQAASTNSYKFFFLCGTKKKHSFKSSNSDQHQISPCNIIKQLNGLVLRIKE